MSEMNETNGGVGIGKPPVMIVVEGTEHSWDKPTITYAEVVTLEVPTYPQHPEIAYSVTFHSEVGGGSEGFLTPGGSVRVGKGMFFNVSETGQS